MSSSEALLQVRHLAAAWDGVPVLHDVSFEVRPGEFLVLLGPNGSGKTTLLRCLAGFEAITGGGIVLAGRDLARVPPHRRGVGLMFQDAALFPHRTVAENIAYAPLLQRRPLDEVTAEVDRVARLLHLEGFEDRRPETLSGGERQRVALARTLAARPRLVLLDEPFASIDAELKAELRTEFRRVLRADGIAAVHVTTTARKGSSWGTASGCCSTVGSLARNLPPGSSSTRPARGPPGSSDTTSSARRGTAWRSDRRTSDSRRSRGLRSPPR